MKNFGYYFILMACIVTVTSCAEPVKQRAKMSETNLSQQSDTITLGGGCFWCVEAVYQQLAGVISVTSGYAGGSVKNPTYRQICEGTTGHAEVIQIVYNTSVTSFKDILEVFFTVHDPTTLNRQGADVGTQYRSVIFYNSSAQQNLALQIIEQLNASGAYASKIVTEVTPLDVFYKAENYHQNYYRLNSSEGYCRMVIQPKLEKFKKVFPDKLIK
ncbi:MAG: peptide-methionine (S)-S-oxide reductase MsrA [Bacteroidia bacterium]|nr:peptide-methionine (S)-S-oxide reductase MsrA [Bacteroidia bacterium]